MPASVRAVWGKGLGIPRPVYSIFAIFVVIPARSLQGEGAEGPVFGLVRRWRIARRIGLIFKYVFDRMGLS